MAVPIIHSTYVLIDPLETAGVTGVASTSTEATGNASIITSYSALVAAGYGWRFSDPAIRINVGSGDADNAMAGNILGSSNEFGPIDGSSSAARGKRLFFTHLYGSTGSALAAVREVGSTGYGHMFWLLSNRDPDLTANSDRTANARGWCVGGSDTVPTLFAPTPTSFIVVDAEHTASEVETGTGTQLTHIDVSSTPNRFDPSSIVCAAWGTKTSGGSYWGTISRLGYYDAYTAYGGEQSYSGNFNLFYSKTQSENHYGVAKGDTSQFRFRLPMEFGTAARSGFPGAETGDSYFEDSNVSVEFSESMQSLTTPIVRVFHAPFNKIGMELFLRSGDVWRCSNISFTGATPWHLRFNSNVGAVVEFNACIIQNAGGEDDDCEFNGDVTITGGLIDGCGKISVNAATIQDVTASNPVSTSLLAITESSDIKRVNFQSTNSAKYAIEIPDPSGGTDDYTFENLTFAGFDFDVRVLGSTGTVNINIAGGAAPYVASGTASRETPVLLGAGWVDGSSYTAVSGGGDGLRAVIAVVSNNGSKAPSGVTFGGEAMTLIGGSVEGTLGLSLWILVESANAGVFSGVQTIAASYSGGDPSSITYQAATYDHIWQRSQTFNINSQSSSSGTGTVLSLDDWSSTDEVNSLIFPVSSGLNRILIVIVNHEDNGQNPGPTGVNYGDQAMTEIGTTAVASYNSSSMFYLLESGIAAATGNTIIATGTVGDTPSLGAASFSDVNQTSPIRDNVSVTGVNPSSGSVLDINNGDMVVGSFASTNGVSSTGLSGELALPDSTFGRNLDDDPSEGAYKGYSSSDTTTGAAGWTGGNNPRTASVFAVLAPVAELGNLDTTVTAEDEGLVISVAQTESTTPFGITFTGDVTEQDEVSVSNRRIAVADYIESAGPASVDANITDTSPGVGFISQMITASIKPDITYSGGPTVNVNNSVTIELTCKDLSDLSVIEGARVYLKADSGGPLSVGAEVLNDLTNVSGVVSTTLNFTSDQPVIGWARKASADPRYKSAPISGTITSNGFTNTTLMIKK